MAHAARKSARESAAAFVSRHSVRVPRRRIPLFEAPVVAVSVYRSRNVPIVAEMIELLPPDSDVRLHALDEPSSVLASRTMNSGAGMRIPLLRMLLLGLPVPQDAWVVLFDDDAQFVRFGPTRFLQYAAAGHLHVAAPAIQPGNPTSHVHMITRALRNARRVGMVDSGPVVAFSPQARQCLDLFPEDVGGMGWGLDVRWALGVAEAGLNMGVVDATPIRHHGPVGADYQTVAERAALDVELAQHGVDLMDLCRDVGPSWRVWQPQAPWVSGRR